MEILIVVLLSLFNINLCSCYSHIPPKPPVHRAHRDKPTHYSSSEEHRSREDQVYSSREHHYDRAPPKHRNVHLQDEYEEDRYHHQTRRIHHSDERHRGKQRDNQKYHSAEHGKVHQKSEQPHHQHEHDNIKVIKASNIELEKDHMKEHMHSSVPVEVEKLSEQEKHYQYFLMHDADHNQLLDGKEMSNIMIHWREHDNKSDEPYEPVTESEIVDMVDGILAKYDFDDDGYINFTEYEAAQKAGD